MVVAWVVALAMIRVVSCRRRSSSGRQIREDSHKGPPAELRQVSGQANESRVGTATKEYPEEGSLVAAHIKGDGIDGHECQADG